MQNEEILDKEIRELLQTLIEHQIQEQADEKEREISRVFVWRLESSDYTGSHKSVLGISTSQLYLDDKKSLIYWTPSCLYDHLDLDMDEVKMQLQKNFIRVQEHELFRVKQKLLYDDWKLLEELMVKLIERYGNLLTESSLRLAEDGLLIVAGDYMDYLKVIGRIESV